MIQRSSARSAYFEPSYSNEEVSEDDLRSSLSQFNSQFEPQDLKIARLQKKPKKSVNMRIEAPRVTLNSPNQTFTNVLRREQNRENETRAPPKLRNIQQIADAKMVKSFAKRYEFLWILIANEKNVLARQQFTKLYEQDKLQSKSKTLENILSHKNSSRFSKFTQQGMKVKIICDFQSFDKSVRNQLKDIQNDPKVLEAHFEEDTINGYPSIARVTHKLKNESNILRFIQETIKEEIQKSRKDAAYFNFIHFDSGPELFNRRSIIKQCLTPKEQQQMQKNHTLFIKQLEKWSKVEYQNDLINLRTKKLSPGEKETEQRRITNRRNRLKEQTKMFAQKMEKYIIEYSPIQDQSQEMQEQFYNWIISFYIVQSPVYPVVNNTMRFSLNSESFEPISVYTRYLYEAIRYHFCNHFRSLKFKKVFRSSRISLVEQKAFVKGRYLWNLGFMSTSIDEQAAQKFMAGKSSDEGVFIIIEISNDATEVQNLQDHEGFYKVENINNVESYFENDEKEILFNPLNCFEIKQFNEKQKTLTLKFAPQLEILKKKNKGIELTLKQKKLLSSFDKLQRKNYDKGVQLFESGNTSLAISYYEKSEETGESLNFTQKSNYIEMLRQNGDYQKMEYLLKQAVVQQESALREQEQNNDLQESDVNIMEQSSIKGSSRRKIFSSKQIEDTIQTGKLFHETSNFEEANQYAERAAQMAEEKAKIEQFPSQETAKLEISGYSQKAKVKHAINESFDSIKQSIKCLQIIDQTYKIHLYERLFQLGKDLKKIKGLEIQQKTMVNVKKILDENDLLDSDMQKLKHLTKQKMTKIRQEDEFDNELIRSSKGRNIDFDSKDQHQQAETIMKNYFSLRDKHNDYRQLDLVFALASWEITSARVNLDKRKKDQEIDERQKLKQVKQEFINARINFMEIIEMERQTYDTLYKNIYKTSLKVEHCLRSYKDNLFGRYDRLIRQMLNYEDKSILIIKVLRSHGEILQEWGGIIERSSLNRSTLETPAEMEGKQKFEEAKNIIRQIQEENKNIEGSLFTSQKTHVVQSLGKYYKGKIIDKQEAKKLSVSNKSFSNDKDIYLSNKQELKEYIKYKGNVFGSLMETLEMRKQLHTSDKSLNQTLFSMKNALQKIQILNQSHGVEVQNQSYSDRLKSCFREYQSFCKVVEKYKQQQIVQKNGNLASLYLLMAQNQFRLGLNINASSFLERAKASLAKSLNLQKKIEKKKKSKLDLDKLEYGNKTKIGIVKLQSHIIAFFGKESDKKKFVKQLLHMDHILSKKMHEPLNQADIKESIGLVYANLMILHKQPTLKYKFQEISKPMSQSIQIRKGMLGPFNKYNARIYTIMMEITTKQQFLYFHEQDTDQFYAQAHQIYNKIDFTTDPMLILYRMQLETTYLILNHKADKAYQWFQNSIRQYEHNKNKQVSLQVAKEYHRAGKFLMSGSQKNREIGLQFLNKSYEHIKSIEKYIQKHYSEDFAYFNNLKNFDKRSTNVDELKKRILQSLIHYERKYGKKEKLQTLQNELDEIDREIDRKEGHRRM